MGGSRSVMRATVLSPLLFAALCSACDSVPLVAPTQSTVRLVVADASVPNGGSTTLTATVTEAAGTPVHDGTVVVFSTTLGDVHPAEAPTVRGRAGATFTAGAESGTADVVAYSGGAVSETVQVVIGTAAVASVRLTARPGSLPPTGGRTTLIATVLDAAQNPLPNVRVTFAASGGFLRNRVVTTDRAGEARTVLTTTTAAEVTASAGEASASATVRIEPPTSIAVDFTPARPIAGQAVSFEVTLTNEARAIRVARIDFGDGHELDLGAVRRTAVTHTYGTYGAYTVTVTATDIAGYAATSSVVVQVDPPPRIPIEIAPSPAAPLAGQPVTFTVAVSPPANAPAVRDATIDFGDGRSTSLGALAGRGSVTHFYERDGNYTVEVTVVDVAERRHVSSIAVTVSPRPGIQVAVRASPASPVEDQPVTFTVDVSPAAGAPAVRDVTVDFGDRSSASLGALTGRGSVAHVYVRADSYIVTVTVLDAMGRRHASSIGLVVAEEEPEG